MIDDKKIPDTKNKISIVLIFAGMIKEMFISIPFMASFFVCAIFSMLQVRYSSLFSVNDCLME